MAHYRLVVTEAAEADIGDGYRWYQEQANLGAAFIDEVNERLAFIEEHPYAYQVVEQGIRRSVVHRFPYNIYYAVNEPYIDILAVWPGRRQTANLLASRTDQRGPRIRESDQ